MEKHSSLISYDTELCKNFVKTKPLCCIIKLYKIMIMSGQFFDIEGLKIWALCLTVRVFICYKIFKEN